MCAIGMRGQLGLHGRLPWEGNKGREYVADVARFFDVTRGHVLIAGPRTIASIPAFAYEDRTIVEIRSNMAPRDVLAQFPDRVVYRRRRPSGVGRSTRPSSAIGTSPGSPMTATPTAGSIRPGWSRARSLSDGALLRPQWSQRGGTFFQELPLLAIWKPRS